MAKLPDEWKVTLATQAANSVTSLEKVSTNCRRYRHAQTLWGHTHMEKNQQHEGNLHRQPQVRRLKGGVRPFFFFACVSFHFLFFFQKSFLTFGQVRGNARHGRSRHPSFRVCKVNLATLKVAINHGTRPGSQGTRGNGGSGWAT